MTLFTTTTTKPQRSSTLQLLDLAYNANGGIIRWTAAPGEEQWILGNTASFGEMSLSMLNAGTAGAQSSHFIFEPIARIDEFEREAAGRTRRHRSIGAKASRIRRSDEWRGVI